MAEYAASGKLEMESYVKIPNCHAHQFQQKNPEMRLMSSKPGAGITVRQGLRSFTQTELTLPGKHSSEKKTHFILKLYSSTSCL